MWDAALAGYDFGAGGKVYRPRQAERAGRGRLSERPLSPGGGMMPRVSLLQLVVRDAGRDRIAAEPNVEQRPPTTFDDPSRHEHALRLGTEDLLQVAHELNQVGYRVHALDIRDDQAQPVDASRLALAEEVEAHMRVGEVAEALGLLRGPGLGLYVWSVELRDTQMPGILRLGRNGDVQAQGDDSGRLVRVIAQHFGADG